jgi:hypothetical protein
MRTLLNIFVVLLLGIAGCTRSARLEDLFSDFSIGVPSYQSVEAFNQSSNQFGAFISKLGVAETNVLSGAGVSGVRVASKIDPKYPWFLSLKAHAVEGPEKRYCVHVEGQQPYD